MIDSHCHLTHQRFAQDLEAVVARGHEEGLAACITIGTGVDDGHAARDIAAQHPGRVFCTAGIDPFSAHDAGEAFDEQFDQMRLLLSSGDFVGWGEIGLDYHYDLDPRQVQCQRLGHQLAAAKELGLPVVIHVRDAHADMAAVLAEHPSVGGVIHSFTGGPAEAEAYLDLGWHIAFNGITTFRNAELIRQAAAIVPDDRLLVETDSPYLAPAPYRGKRCEPHYVAHTLERLAQIRDSGAEQLSEITAANARRLFRLPASARGD